MDRQTKKCVIFGAGDFNTDYVKSELTINPGDFCIAADAGLLNFDKLGLVPDLVIGDMDSLKEDRALSGLEVKRLPVEKDDTDMLAAIKEGLERGYKRFELYGALGGRFDHAIANIQCLVYLENQGAKGILYGNKVRVEMIYNEKICYPSDYNKKYKKISVFAYGNDAQGVTERGLKYTLDDAVLKQEFPMGVSNEFTGQESMIEVKKGRLLICVGDFM